MNQRKKSKFRRRINRMKNKIQYLRKRVGVPVTCFLLCFSLISVTLFSTKQQAYATGVEEIFYYTYWDLISGLFAETGYQYSVKDEYYTSPKRASGEQIWDNFCTWVENKAKALSLPVAVVHDELKNLPNVVTQAGVTMSEKLAEILAKVLPTAVDETASGGNFFDDSNFENYAAVIAGICGTSVALVPEYGTFGKNIAYHGNVGESQSYLLNIVAYDRYYYIFEDCYNFDSEFGANGGFKVLGADWARGAQGSICFDTVSKYYTESVKLFPYPDCGYTWIMRNGQIASADGIAQSDYARVKVKEKTEDKDGVYIPGVGWKTKWNVWDDVLDGQGATDKEKDEWWLRYHVNELLKDLPDSGDVDPDDEKRRKQDNEKDKLPVVLPIPFKPDKDTEKDTETETESESEKDTEPAPGPIPKPNPTEDGSEDDTESQKHIQDVIINAGGSSGGNWKKLFPFCIPWDIMTLIKSMNAEKKAPHFKYEHTFKGINYTFSIDVDMSDYWKYIKIFRWGMTIFFIIGLFFLTVKFTTFVHRGS